MDLFETIEVRQSIRRFRNVPVELEQLTQILKAAIRAPSAGNLQAYRVFLVKGSAVRQILARAAGNQGCVAEAPVVLVFCADPARSAVKFGARGQQHLCLQDATIACAYAQLAATALELASVWIGAVVEPEAVKEALRLEEGLWPVALLPLGYPAEQPARNLRRTLAELVQELPSEA